MFSSTAPVRRPDELGRLPDQPGGRGGTAGGTAGPNAWHPLAPAMRVDHATLGVRTRFIEQRVAEGTSVGQRQNGLGQFADVVGDRCHQARGLAGDGRRSPCRAWNVHSSSTMTPSTPKTASCRPRAGADRLFSAGVPGTPPGRPASASVSQSMPDTNRSWLWGSRARRCRSARWSGRRPRRRPGGWLLQARQEGPPR